MENSLIVHNHLIVNADIEDTLDSPEDAIEFLKEFVAKMGMKILLGPLATYVTAPGNEGVTAIVGIETSHVAFHVWNQREPAQLRFDLYTCGDLDLTVALDAIHARFKITGGDYRFYDRERTINMLSGGALPEIYGALPPPPARD